MEKWQDQGLILELRPHGESGAIVSALTENHGRTAGYVRGAGGSRMRGTLEPGNLVDINWQTRVEGNLGTFTLELSKSHAALFMQDALKLAALQSACALCDQALPEGEGHPGLFYGLEALLQTLDSEIWGAAYVMWEIALLKELGFALQLTECAGGGDAAQLAYVSPKTGRAVSLQAGEPYKDKLLALPGFLKPGGALDTEDDILTGLKLTGYFLQHWAFAHHSRGVPENRLRFQLRFEQHFAKTLGGTSIKTSEYATGS